MKLRSRITFIPISFLKRQEAHSFFISPDPRGFHYGKSILPRNIGCMRTRPVCLSPAENPTASLFCLVTAFEKKKNQEKIFFISPCLGLFWWKSSSSVFENLIPAPSKPEISPEVIPRQREGRNNRALLFRKRGWKKRTIKWELFCSVVSHRGPIWLRNLT